jgi:putative alpha-1,2-mannosidase
MASFMLLSMMGLFPNPGQNVYLISSPFFESLTITNQLTNKTATIRATNFDGQDKNIYIQKALLNGRLYTKNWIGHEFFAQGWTLELELGNTESAWGMGVGDRPPSLSTVAAG